MYRVQFEMLSFISKRRKDEKRNTIRPAPVTVSTQMYHERTAAAASAEMGRSETEKKERFSSETVGKKK